MFMCTILRQTFISSNLEIAHSKKKWTIKRIEEFSKFVRLCEYDYLWLSFFIEFINLFVSNYWLVVGVALIVYAIDFTEKLH